MMTFHAAYRSRLILTHECYRPILDAHGGINYHRVLPGLGYAT